MGAWGSFKITIWKSFYHLSKTSLQGTNFAWQVTLRSLCLGSYVAMIKVNMDPFSLLSSDMWIINYDTSKRLRLHVIFNTVLCLLNNENGELVFSISNKVELGILFWRTFPWAIPFLSSLKIFWWKSNSYCGSVTKSVGSRIGLGPVKKNRGQPWSENRENRQIVSPKSVKIDDLNFKRICSPLSRFLVRFGPISG